jgi:hypothetical protein
LRIRGSVGQSTSISSFKGDVSFLSPHFSPGVLNNPGIFGISNKGNSVIKVLFTVREDSGAVELEVFSINGDGDGGHGDGFG